MPASDTSLERIVPAFFARGRIGPVALAIWLSLPATGTRAGEPGFTKGLETFSLAATYQNERTGEDIYLASITAGFGKYVLNNAALELQLVGYHGHDDSDSAGLGANVMGRYHFLNFQSFSVYGDVLGGVFVMSNDFPTNGTEFNFTYAGGPGLSVRLREGLFLNGGIRFQHVSNGFIAGRDRNPVLNSFGGYLGMMWTH